MNIFKNKSSDNENLSVFEHLLMIAILGYYGFLSKTYSDTPNRYKMAFLLSKICLDVKSLQVMPNNLAKLNFFSIMAWLILQNKPLGEYVKRLLYVPRVRPCHPICGNFLSTQKRIGA